jgi:ABC-2 type transport system ATP-binding protein
MLLKEYPFVDKLISGEDTIQAGFEGDEADMSRVLSELVMVGIPVVSFAQLDGNLEDVFMKVTKGDEE